MLKKFLLTSCLLLSGACASPSPAEPVKEVPKTAEAPVEVHSTIACLNEGDSVITFAGQSLLIAIEMINSARSDKCQETLQQLMNGKMDYKEGVKFLTQEIKAWEDQKRFLNYLRKEIK